MARQLSVLQSGGTREEAVIEHDTATNVATQIDGQAFRNCDHLALTRQG